MTPLGCIKEAVQSKLKLFCQMQDERLVLSLRKRFAVVERFVKTIESDHQ